MHCQKGNDRLSKEKQMASIHKAASVSPSLHSQRILSAHSTRATRVAGVTKLAFLLARSDSRTPRAREQAVQTWMGVPNAMVFVNVSASGGHPTGTTASATQLRISPTASPSKKICTS